MKKILALLLALVMLSISGFVYAADIEGFTPIAGTEDKFTVNSDKSVTITHNNNISAYFDIDPKKADYSFQVTIIPPADSYVAIGMDCLDAGGCFTGLWFKFREDLAGMYDNTDPNNAPHKAVSMVSGESGSTLNITSGESTVKVIKKDGKFTLYVNGILAYENITPAKSVGTKITIGANYNGANTCTFKKFIYTDASGKKSYYLGATKDDEVTSKPAESQVASSQAASSTVQSSAAQSSAAQSSAVQNKSSAVSNVYEEKANNTWIYILIAVIGVIAIGTVVFIILKKKKTIK